MSLNGRKKKYTSIQRDVLAKVAADAVKRGEYHTALETLRMQKEELPETGPSEEDVKAFNKATAEYLESLGFGKGKRGPKPKPTEELSEWSQKYRKIGGKYQRMNDPPDYKKIRDYLIEHEDKVLAHDEDFTDPAIASKLKQKEHNVTKIRKELGMYKSLRVGRPVGKDKTKRHTKYKSPTLDEQKGAMIGEIAKKSRQIQIDLRKAKTEEDRKLLLEQQKLLEGIFKEVTENW